MLDRVRYRGACAALSAAALSMIYGNVATAQITGGPPAGGKSEGKSDRVQTGAKAYPQSGPGGSGAPRAVVPSAGGKSLPDGSMGVDLYVLVRKLARINARPATAFTPPQAEKLYDLLEPLYERPELAPQETHGLLAAARGVLTPAQRGALDALRDINRKSVLPPPGGPMGQPPFGQPGGLPGGPPMMLASNSRSNPFYAAPGNLLSERAIPDLRDLLDALERTAPPAAIRTVPTHRDAAQKVHVTTFHNDLARRGWNQNERTLTPRNVDKSHFGRWWHTRLDGQVYAAPLVVTDVHISNGTHDVIISPTENNTVYALDADTGKVLWERHLATSLTDEEYNDCINITPRHGITSTPVIDLDRKEIYVCGLTSAKLKQMYKVWALDLETGEVKSGWPVTLRGQFKGCEFDSGQLTQRGALLMVDGWLYIPFASRCDIGEWHGWVMGLNSHDPNSPQRAFSPSPDTSGGGIWGSAGLASDPDGNVYAVTGNGDYNLDSGGHTIVESIVRLKTGSDLSFSYQPKDYYVPANHEELDRVDADLGGSSAMVLDHPGSATPHLLVTGGKDGNLYLVDRDNLGGVGGEIQKQRLYGGTGGGYASFIKTTPAYFEDGQGGQYVVITGNDKSQGGTQGVVALKLGLDSQKRSHLTPFWSTGRPLYQPGTAVVSSNGKTDAIVWVVESNKNDDDIGPSGVLHAYDARTGKDLYRSNQRERRDSLGDARKFSAPTVANGRVYCGTDGVVAYGPIEERKNAK